MPFFKHKERKKRLEQWFGRQTFNAIMLATRVLTIERSRSLGRVLGKLAFHLMLRHRRLAMHNIALIYGREKSKQQLREIVKRTFIHASCFGWETLYLYTHNTTDQEIDDLVNRVEGLKHLKSAVAQGNGVIAIGAHLGNFALIGRKLDILGFPSTAIMRQMRDTNLESLFTLMKANFKLRWIPKFPISRAVKESLAWLKQGKVLMVYIDQRSSRGLRVDFMGVPTVAPTGAAVFALTTQAAVVPIVNVQDKDGSYKMIIGEQVPLVKTGKHKEDILQNTVNFNQVIEKYIRSYPDQWFWFHNRWKGVKASEV